MPNPAARTRGRNCRAIRTPPDWGPDIFHPLLLTFDSIEEFGQRYISPRSSLPARRRPTVEVGPLRRADWMGFQTRSSRFVVREILLVGIAAAASFVFINHDNLYLSHPFRLSDARIESYFLATAMVYLFLRLVIVALELRPPRGHGELVRCPECGQWLADPSAAALQAHRRTEPTPKPSRQEIVSAVALRKAVDAARFGNLTHPLESQEPNPAARIPVNATSEDLVAALDDPDYLERMRHSPRPPADPRLKR